jgi:hypothetical protein
MKCSQGHMAHAGASRGVLASRICRTPQAPAARGGGNGLTRRAIPPSTSAWIPNNSNSVRGCRRVDSASPLPLGIIAQPRLRCVPRGVADALETHDGAEAEAAEVDGHGATEVDGHGYYEYRGHRCHYERRGDMRHPHIVLLPGFGVGTFHFRAQLEARTYTRSCFRPT